MRSRLSLIALPVTVAALMLASGCGGDDNETDSAGSAPSAGGQTVSVSETDYELDPSDPTVQPGTVSFEVTNDGGVAHNLEVEGPKGEVELEQDIGPGESDTLTVDLSSPAGTRCTARSATTETSAWRARSQSGAAGAAASSGSDDAGGTTTTTTTGGGGYGY